MVQVVGSDVMVCRMFRQGAMDRTVSATIGAEVTCMRFFGCLMDGCNLSGLAHCDLIWECQMCLVH